MHRGPMDHTEAAIWAEGYEDALKDVERILAIVLDDNTGRIAQALDFLREEQ